MNFKDAYKSYNDEIKGNPEVLNSILNGNVKLKPVFNYRPVLAYAAMAALVISVSVFGYNKFYDEPKPTKRYIASNNVSDTDITHATTETPDVSDTKTAEQNITDTNQPSQNESPNATSPASEVSLSENNSGEVAIQSENIVSVEPDDYASDELRAETEALQVPETHMDIPDTKPDLPMGLSDEADLSADTHTPIAASEDEIADISVPMPARSGGSGGGMAAYSPESDGETLAETRAAASGIPADDYFEYLGVDIISKARLPEDMMFEEPQAAMVEYEDGVIVSDMFTLTAHSTEDSQRNLSLSVTKKGPYAGRFTNDISYAYTGDDEKIVGAYTMAGDISVSLGVQNVTKEEINNLMKSLKTEE